LADPLLSGPDEPAHLIRAEAIVRGQLIGRPVASLADNPDNPETTVRVPGFLANSNSLAYWCFIFRPDTTAACAPPLTGPDHLVSLPTYVGHYPPLYYVAVGWPSLLDDGRTGVLWMRLVSALINSLLLGTALWLAVRRSRILVVAVLVAATPTVIYYSASVNPNGLEMTSALCFWCAVLGLAMPWPSRGIAGAGAVPSVVVVGAGAVPSVVVEGAGAVPSVVVEGAGSVPSVVVEGAGSVPSSPVRAEIVIAAVSGCVLASSRGLSPAWLLVAVGAALIGGDVGRIRRLVRRRSARVAGAVTSVAIVAAVAWTIAENGLVELGYPNHASYVTLFHLTLRATPHYLSEMVGYFGANNVPAPPFATTTVVVGLAALALAAFVVGSWRERGVLTLLLIAIVAVPIASGVVSGHHYGLIWQGRYTLAIGVGSPIFAGYVVGAWYERRRLEVGSAVGGAAGAFSSAGVAGGVASGGVASAGVASAGAGGVASAGVASAGVASAGVASAGVASGGVASAGVASAGVASAGVASAGVASAGAGGVARAVGGSGRLVASLGAGAVVLAIALAVSQFTSFLWVLRRFMVGANGPFSGVFGGIWQPPVDGFVLLISAGCGAVAVALLVLRASRDRQVSQ
jgi:hypothetical protein